jgi:hypothetical protein
LDEEYLKTALPGEPGAEMDLLMARHMGARAIESGGLPWLLEGNRAYAVPPYSTDHNAFFGRVVGYLRAHKIRIAIHDGGDHFVIACKHPRHGTLAEEKQESLPHAGCLAAISALRALDRAAIKQIGPRDEPAS